MWCWEGGLKEEKKDKVKTYNVYIVEQSRPFKNLW